MAIKESLQSLLEELAEGDNIVSCTLSDEEMKQEFLNDFGCDDVKHFTAWSEEFVYYSTSYDGHISVDRVKRNPV
jgi:hypothetical protein